MDKVTKAFVAAHQSSEVTLRSRVLRFFRGDEEKNELEDKKKLAESQKKRAEERRAMEEFYRKKYNLGLGAKGGECHTDVSTATKNDSGSHDTFGLARLQRLFSTDKDGKESHP